MENVINSIFRLLQVLGLTSIALFLLAFINFTNSSNSNHPVAWCGTCGNPSLEKRQAIIPDSMLLPDVAKGKELFEGNCVACHAIEKDKVGPALMGISKRRSKKWIRSFVRNSQKMIKRRDPIAVALYNKYYQTEMTAFTSFTDEEIDAIVKYVDIYHPLPRAVIYD